MKIQHYLTITIIVTLLICIKLKRKEIVDFFRTTNISLKRSHKSNFRQINDGINPSEEIIFKSKKMHERYFNSFFENYQNLPDINIKAKIVFPKTKKEKVPAIIFIHGQGAIKKIYQVYLKRINKLGIAILTFNNFTPRGAKLGTNKLNPSIGSNVLAIDALMALKELQKHPRIDSKSIGVLGVSIGGTASFLTAWKPLLKFIKVDNNPFKVHISLYPFCPLLKKRELTKYPVYIFSGDKDTWSPINHCIKMIKHLKNEGYENFHHTIFKNVAHQFDYFEGFYYFDGTRFSDPQCMYQLEKSGNFQTVYKEKRDNQKKCIKKQLKVLIGGTIYSKRKTLEALTEILKNDLIGKI